MADVFVDIVKSIKGKNDANNKPIKLVSNSGIQFIDFEFDEVLDFESGEKEYYPKYIKQGQFAKHPKYADHYARFHLDRINNCLRIDDFETALDLEDSYDAEDSVKMIDSLNLYNGIWFPIPYFSKNKDDSPVNFARARIINKSKLDDRDSGGEYHVTFAFDTKVLTSEDPFKCTPSEQQINEPFTFRGGIEATKMLQGASDGNSFVEAWAKSVYEKVFEKSYQKKDKYQKINDWLENRYYEKHYLNLIAFLEHFVQPNDIRLMPFSEKSTNSPTDVSLVMDIGNTRSFGILVEDDGSSKSDLKTNPQLEIRDLNSVEKLYVGSFESKVQFQKACFDFNYASAVVSSKQESFVWPSLVRVGSEAVKLAANAEGTEGRTGLISPKRYLWQLELDNPDNAEEWNFNNNYYQIPMRCQKADDNTSYEEIFYKDDESEKTAIYPPVSDFINSSGDALFADTSNNADESQMKALYTGKSIMTFMLVEIILQSLMQINSYHYRHNKSNEDRPRRLTSIVLTTPPAMSDLEREVFRSCVYQAIGLVWKAYGFDKSPACEFEFSKKEKEMFPRPPKVMLHFNETMAGQLVYFYNETQKVFNGNALDYVKHIRRYDANGRFNEYPPVQFASKDADYKTARIASIDIGGGTTDLVITDYSVPETIYKSDVASAVSNQQGIVQIREVLKDGNKVAGDDLVKEIIKEEIIPQLENNFNLTNIVGKSQDSGSSRNIQKRVQTVEQIFTKIAYTVLKRIEQLAYAPVNVTSVITKGSVNDFIKGTDKCEILDGIVEKKLSNFNVDESIREFVNKGLGTDTFFDFELSFDVYRINRKLFHNASNDLSNTLDYLNTLVNAYKCDVLLLTGRASKLPGIRRLIESKSYLSASRIISMHSYDCSSWYPAFSLENGKIGDPKTSVVVGAAIGFIKMNDVNSLVNFRINPTYQLARTPVRYMGPTNGLKIEKDAVEYIFKTVAEEKVLKRASENEPLTEKDLKKIFNSEEANEIKLEKTTDAVLKTAFVINPPAVLGYRQFSEEDFNANALYSVVVADNVNSLKKVKATKDLYIPETDEFSFDDEGFNLFNEKIFNNLFSEHNYDYKAEGIKLFNEARDRVEALVAQLDEAQSFAMADSNSVASASLDSSNVFYDVANEFNSNATATAQNAQASIKQTGLMAKLTGAQNKALDAYNQAFNEYKASHEAELLNNLIEIKNNQEYGIKGLFVRELCDVIVHSNEKLKDSEEAKLKEIASQIKNHGKTVNLTVELKSKIDDKDAIGRSIGFVYDQIGTTLPTLNLLNIEDAEFVDDVSVKGKLKDYLTLKLKTVSYDEDYWNNSGELV